MATLTALSDSPAMRLRRGTNQSGTRLYNERLVLSLVRETGTLPKADIARQTGLSPPAVQTIVQRLEADGLLVRQAATRGRVGQPSVPFALNPEGAFSLGLKIGRRSADLVLVDFTGAVRREWHLAYSYPAPAAIVNFARGCWAEITAELNADARARLAGFGVATPFELWNWEEEVDAPPGAMQEWRGFDLPAEIEALSGLPVYLCNDASAGCAAELLLGRAGGFLDVLYIFVAWFIGGGLVLNGHLFPGRGGYAGSVGQMLVPGEDSGGRPAPMQLLHRASLYLLERRVEDAGGDATAIRGQSDDWARLEPHLSVWIEEAADAIAAAIVSAVALGEFEAAIIDGAFPETVRARLVARVEAAVARLERRGLRDFVIVEGSMGNNARAIGGAALPLLAKFMRDRALLFQTPTETRDEPTALHLSRRSSF